MPDAVWMLPAVNGLRPFPFGDSRSAPEQGQPLGQRVDVYVREAQRGHCQLVLPPAASHANVLPGP